MTAPTRQERIQHFIDRAKALHGDLYDYALVPGTYVNAKTPVSIICRTHGAFTQVPDQHARTYNTTKHKNTGGCPICSHESRTRTRSNSQQQFLDNARSVHGCRYQYDHAVYVNAHTKIIITCVEHGPFRMSPKDHVTGKQGCRQCCYRKHHSGKAIRWLEKIEQQRGVMLQRIGRGQEYRVPSTRYHVDGYDPNTNTVYEFYGDRFHGNPDKYGEEERCHPFDAVVTAGELYQKTMNRERELIALGYSVVSLWESEFAG